MTNPNQRAKPAEKGNSTASSALPKQHGTVHTELRGPRQCQFVAGNVGVADSSAPKDKGKRKPSAAVARVAFTSNKTNEDFVHLAGGGVRPRKKQKIANVVNTGQDVLLTARKPVKTFIPCDAWALIFARSHPKFLLQARLVCRDFREILSHQSVWKEARENHFGPGLPECPPKLTEFQYANLLAGRGCQIKPCHRRETRKTYWPFLLRACEECLQKITQTMPDFNWREAGVYRELRNKLGDRQLQYVPHDLSDLLPAGIMLQGRWVDARPLDSDSRFWQQHHVKHSVLAQEYEALRVEFADTVVKDPSTFFSWTRNKWLATRTRMKTARAINEVVTDVSNPRRALRVQKENFYRDSASRLNPPITFEVLSRMAAYQQVVENPNQPSRRSWELLCAKIDVPVLRAQALQLVEWDKERNSMLPFNPTGGENEAASKFLEHRSSTFHQPGEDVPQPPAEIRVLLGIAERELSGILDHVDDENVLLVWLNSILSTYENLPTKPPGWYVTGEELEYWPLLDDARIVIDQVLVPKLQLVSEDRRRRVMASLRCIGCTRSDSNKLYTFEGLMLHIRNTHAKRVGENTHFWKLSQPPRVGPSRSRDAVAWYELRWPRSMPAVLRQQKVRADTSWDPEVATTLSPQAHQHTKALAFLEPRPWLASTPAESPDNFRYAIKQFQDTRLDTVSKFTLGLMYAKRLRDESNRGNGFSIRDFSDADDVLHEAPFLLGSDLEFPCGVCVNDRDMMLNPNAYLRGSFPIRELVDHWMFDHNYKADQEIDGLVELPKDAALIQTVQDVDEKLQAQIKREKVRNRRAVTEQRQSGLDPRSATLFDIPMAGERLSSLFMGLSKAL